MIRSQSNNTNSNSKSCHCYCILQLFTVNNGESRLVSGCEAQCFWLRQRVLLQKCIKAPEWLRLETSFAEPGQGQLRGLLARCVSGLGCQESSTFRTFAGNVDVIQLTTPLWIILENVDLGDGDEGSGANMVSHMLGSIGYTTRSLIHTVNVVWTPVQSPIFDLSGLSLELWSVQIEFTAVWCVILVYLYQY